MKYKFLILAVFSLFYLNLKTSAQAGTTKHPNVLFIMIDDLRPDLHCYGSNIFGDNNIIQSPHIDSLASVSVLFKNQYAVIPTCGASRCAILTGYLPRSPAALSNEACVTFISNTPHTDQPKTFIANLKDHGYYTVGIGKISHYPDGYVYPYTSPVSDKLELPDSWNEMLFNPGKWGTGWNAFFGYANGTNRNSLHKEVKPYEKADVDDEGYPDALTADLAIKTIKRLATKDKPFFLAVGFFKPHLPFNAPKKYWDLYDESKISLTHSPGIPKNVNTASLHNSAEFNQYKLSDEHPTLKNPVSDAYQRKLRHAYYAAVSYSDAQVGKVLDELKESGLDKNTIIVLWSDHGWHLGDDRVWGKHTLFEYATRSVLIVKTPDMKKGKSCDRVVSSIDIYPTLMELCHVPMPHPTDGVSFVKLLHHPDSHKWKNVAFSYFKQGISLRTKRYRLTRYFRKQEPTIELYDHKTDPFENVNIASSHPKIVKELMKIWNKGNTGLYDKK